VEHFPKELSLTGICLSKEICYDFGQTLHGLSLVFAQLAVEVKYPPNWNDHQTWKCVLTACRASGYLVFQHKEFFQG